MRDRTPNMRTTLLGITIGRWMAAEGLHRSEIARLIDVSPSRISRLLSGKRGVNPADIAGIAALCHVGAAERDRALRLTENLRDTTWVLPSSKGSLEDLDVTRHVEQHARHVTVFQPGVLPDLLRTAAYARLQLRSRPLTKDHDVEQQVRLLHERRAALNPTRARGERARQPTQFQFLFSERALHQTSLEPHTLQEQLGHLLQVGLLPTVDLRILPAAGVADIGHSFYLCEFEEQLTAVCLVNLNSVTVLEDDATVAGYQELATELRATAMSPDESRDFLASTAKALVTTAPHTNPVQPSSIYETATHHT